MELKEFISSAISDIAEAVSEADAYLKSVGGLMNPGDYKNGLGGGTFDAPRTTLNFDVAVAAQSSGGVSGGLKARILVIEASLSGEKGATHSSSSRLTFSLDVVLPHDPNQEARIPRNR
jgi:hypothetical protein